MVIHGSRNVRESAVVLQLYLALQRPCSFRNVGWHAPACACDWSCHRTTHFAIGPRIAPRILKNGWQAGSLEAGGGCVERHQNQGTCAALVINRCGARGWFRGGFGRPPISPDLSTF
jgi:hypothetical protein